MNFNCTFVDDANIYIGDGTMIAPNVTIITAMHPLSAKLRSEGYGYNKPVYIGKNVWIASNVIAMGSPAKVLREITSDDDIYYNHGKLISENIVY